MGQRVDLHPKTKQCLTEALRTSTDKQGRPSFNLRQVMALMRANNVQDPARALVSLMDHWRANRPEMAMQLGCELADAYQRLHVRNRQLVNAYKFIVEHTGEPKELDARAVTSG